MSKIIGRSVSHETMCNLENGIWNVHSKIIEGRLLDDSQVWETATIEAFALHTNFDKAYKQALEAALKEFMDKTVARGFNSLIESREYDSKLGLVERAN